MYSNESDVQESRGFDISWMQTIMNGLILWLCMVCHVYHTLHEGWMLSSRLEVFGRNIGVIQGLYKGHVCGSFSLQLFSKDEICNF